MLRTIATIGTIGVFAVLVMVAPTARAAKTKPVEVALKGKFVEKDGKILFKAGGKSFEINLKKVLLQKHRVKKLVDLSCGDSHGRLLQVQRVVRRR